MSPPPDREVTVLDPFGPAVDRTVGLLFRPFRAGPWIAIAFAFWMAKLGTGGGGFQNVLRFGGAPQDLARRYLSWLQADALLTVLATATAIVVVAGSMALFTWLRARFELIRVDVIARNRAAIAEPWRLHREAGNRLFGLMFLLAAATILVLGTVGFGVLILAGPDLEDGGPVAARTWIVLALGTIAALATGLAAKVIGLAITIFVVPWTWRHEGARPLEVLRRIPGALEGAWLPLLGFVAVRIGVGIAIGAAGFLLMVLTCCLGTLPFVGTVLLLPLLVFQRQYELGWVAQLGSDWVVHGTETEVPRCHRCGFDLRAAASDRCPECGTSIVDPEARAAARDLRCRNCGHDLVGSAGPRCGDCGEPIPAAILALVAPPPAPPPPPPPPRPTGEIPVPELAAPAPAGDGDRAPAEGESDAAEQAKSDPPSPPPPPPSSAGSSTAPPEPPDDDPPWRPGS